MKSCRARRLPCLHIRRRRKSFRLWCPALPRQLSHSVRRLKVGLVTPADETIVFHHTRPSLVLHRLCTNTENRFRRMRHMRFKYSGCRKPDPRHAVASPKARRPCQLTPKIDCELECVYDKRRPVSKPCLTRATLALRGSRSTTDTIHTFVPCSFLQVLVFVKL